VKIVLKILKQKISKTAWEHSPVNHHEPQYGHTEDHKSKYIYLIIPKIFRNTFRKVIVNTLVKKLIWCITSFLYCSNLVCCFYLLTLICCHCHFCAYFPLFSKRSLLLNYMFQPEVVIIRFSHCTKAIAHFQCKQWFFA
jgi:hypothetical protein